MDRLDPMASPSWRRAFFVRSRCITMLNEVLSAARSCDLDVSALEQALEAGRARSAVLRQSQEANCSGVVGLPDGSEHCNPGVRTRWIGTELRRSYPGLSATTRPPFVSSSRMRRELFIEEDHHDNRD